MASQTNLWVFYQKLKWWAKQTFEFLQKAKMASQTLHVYMFFFSFSLFSSLKT